MNASRRHDDLAPAELFLGAAYGLALVFSVLSVAAVVG